MRADGNLQYFCEGQVGDMSFVRGNRAVRDHAAEGRDLLLFRNLRDGLRYEGQMVYDGHHMEPAPDRTGATRQAIVFQLRPLEAIEEAPEDDAPPAADDLAELRRLAMEATVAMPARVERIASAFERSRHVRDYVVARSKGALRGLRRSGPLPSTERIALPRTSPHQEAERWRAGRSAVRDRALPELP